MARASRSNKKQPAFDPSELTDLIFTPAVGTGVGSHLVGTGGDFPAPTEHASSRSTDVTTVDKIGMATVDTIEMATVGNLNRSTVVNFDQSTVDICGSTRAAPGGGKGDLATMDNSEMATVANDDQSTVDNINQSTVDKSEATSARDMDLWITEQGGLVPAGRVKQIRLAQDVISSAEACVYDTLWTASSVPTAEPGAGADPSRVVQAGYDYLAKHTQLSKRTVQRIVEKLIDKDFIAIERPADIYQRSSTVYRVFSYGTVLDRHMQKGRLHIAKLGPGLSYVRSLRRESATVVI